jgi:uncharacterized protein (DUF2236 family)
MTTAIDEVVAGVRRTIGGAIFERVAGPDGAEVRERLRGPEADPQFAPGSPITRVHGDASMFVGGLSALLLQSLHPLAMAGVAEHSGYRGDPWGRLARTSHFLAVTTFGSAEEAQREIDVVKAVHRRVVGIAPDGRPYSATDPHLLAWVHLAEVVSFVRSHQRYGAQPLTAAEADEYVDQSGHVALALGADAVPHTVAEAVAMLEAYRPELEGTPAARSAARFLVANPPLPVALRPAYLPIAAAGVSLLPRWARWPLRLPWLPVTEATVARAAGELATRTIRWALPAGAGTPTASASADPGF